LLVANEGIFARRERGDFESTISYSRASSRHVICCQPLTPSGQIEFSIFRTTDEGFPLRSGEGEHWAFAIFAVAYLHSGALVSDFDASAVASRTAGFAPNVRFHLLAP
jgi:hypothetical protein